MRPCSQVGSFNSNGFLPLCTSVARSSSQSRDPWYLEGKVLSAHPGSHCVVSCSRNTCTAACQMTRWWGMSSWYCAKNCNWTRWKFTVPVLPWKVQFFRLQSFKIYQILPVQLLFTSSHISWCCLLHHLPRNPSVSILQQQQPQTQKTPSKQNWIL